MNTKMVWEADVNGDGINNVIGKGRLSDFQARRTVSVGKLSVLTDIHWNNRVPIETPAVYSRNSQSLNYLEQTTVINGELTIDLDQHGGPISVLRAMGPMGTTYSRGIEWKGKLTSSMIEWMEDRRKGNDFTLQFHLRAVIFRSAQLQRASDSVTVSANSLIQTVTGTWGSVPVAASTWVATFLPQLGYQGPQYIELPPLPTFETGQSVRQHFDSAGSALRAGQYRAVPMHCLAALDALAKSKSYSGFGGIPEVDGWLTGYVPERSKVLTTFRQYLNRWRHDNTSKGGVQESTAPLEREEAAFVYVTALFMAQILIGYLPVASA